MEQTGCATRTIAEEKEVSQFSFKLLMEQRGCATTMTTIFRMQMTSFQTPNGATKLAPYVKEE